MFVQDVRIHREGDFWLECVGEKEKEWKALEGFTCKGILGLGPEG